MGIYQIFNSLYKNFWQTCYYKENIKRNSKHSELKKMMNIYIFYSLLLILYKNEAKKNFKKKSYNKNILTNPINNNSIIPESFFTEIEIFKEVKHQLLVKFIV